MLAVAYQPYTKAFNIYLLSPIKLYTANNVAHFLLPPHIIKMIHKYYILWIIYQSPEGPLRRFLMIATKAFIMMRKHINIKNNLYKEHSVCQY